MGNLKVYNAVRVVPREAQKQIAGGRLKGKTDINPMWRIKTLTELFGVCGIGWKAPIKRLWTEAGANSEITAFCEIELFIKVDGQWSEAITGLGGSMLVEKEKNGLYTSDECYKMAYTDAISVACKMLGVGADIYWQADTTKYSEKNKRETPPQAPRKTSEEVKAEKIDRIRIMEELKALGIKLMSVAQFFEVDINDVTDEMFKMSIANKKKELSTDDLIAYKASLKNAES